jgi:hypothetical protein
MAQLPSRARPSTTTPPAAPARAGAVAAVATARGGAAALAAVASALVAAPIATLGMLALVACTAPCAGCGRKTDVKPPQLVAPHTVTEVSLTTLDDGVSVKWTRPTKYVDGTNMEDLGGFVVERSRNNEQFEELTRVPVTDRGRFQKVNRFDYADKQMLRGTTYHYRIVAFTTDGYYSAPSGAATITWDPQPSPSPSTTPAGSASPRPRRTRAAQKES